MTIIGMATVAAEDLYSNPLELFREAIVPALTNSERGKVETTWRGFFLRADHQSEFKREHDPSDFGIFLDVSVRDAVEVPKFVDSRERTAGLTRRTVKFPAVRKEHDAQGLVVTLVYGDQADAESIKAIDRFIAGVRRKAEQSSTGQPATKPADKRPIEDQPSTPTSKGSPR